MGRSARLNERSTDGGKPRAYVAFHRCLRAARSFGEDHAGYARWLAGRNLGESEQAAMERLWSELHPAPLVTLHTLDEVPR